MKSRGMIYMTEPHVASTATLDVPGDPELTTETVSRTPVLITEREVAFATAAAVPLPSTATRRWTEAIRIAFTAIRGIYATPTADSSPARRHYPARTDFLQHSRMAREMHRL